MVARQGKLSVVSKRDLMLRTWQGLGQPRVGRRELRQIQNALIAAFGRGALESPTAIARVLAGEGAELRHPEVIEFDARWRESEINREEQKFRALPERRAGGALDFAQTEALIRSLEDLRLGFEDAHDQSGLARLKALAVEERETAQLNSRNESTSAQLRAAQAEIAEWLKIWIQTPNLFADWIELRKCSPEFRRKFLEEL